MRVRHAHAALIVTAFLALAPVAPGAPAAAAESGLWSAGSTTLRSGPSGYVAATAGGERRLALPAGVEVEELFALGQRAFLSGRQAPQRSAPGHPPSRDLYLALIDAAGPQPLPSPAAVYTPGECFVPLDGATCGTVSVPARPGSGSPATLTLSVAVLPASSGQVGTVP